MSGHWFFLPLLSISNQWNDIFTIHHCPGGHFCLGFTLIITLTHWPLRGFNYHLKLVYFKLISMINILSIFCEIAMRWMPQHLTDHKSTLVQVLAWCHQATRPRSLLTYDPGHMTSLGHKELSSDNNSDWENHWTETTLHPLPGACDQNRANKIQINCGGLVMCNASLN